MTTSRRGLLGALLALGLTTTGCYHYRFEHRDPPPGSTLVRYTERQPTYLNGFVGSGDLETDRYCDDPVRTELRVTATDVLLSMATLLVYTPHTLSVVCAEEPRHARDPGETPRRSARAGERSSAVR